MQIFDGQIRFGIHSGQQNTTYDDYVYLWKKAEELGYDWASIFDHFLPIFSDPEGPCFEGFTLLGALAAQTSKIRCGILCAGVTYRSPTLLANIAATLDHVSMGRLELGIGGGWYSLEHEQYGIPFPSARKRLDMMGEACAILKSMWTNHRTTYSGHYYEVSEALCEPKPLQKPHIPLWIGGRGEKVTLRVVAEVADGWNTFCVPIDEYKHKLNVLSQHCGAIGRDPSEIRKSLIFDAIIGETETELAEQVSRIKDLKTDVLGDGRLFGTPDQCAERLLDYVALGVGDFLLRVRSPANMRTLELIATKVAPIVKGEGQPLLGE